MKKLVIVLLVLALAAIAVWRLRGPRDHNHTLKLYGNVEIRAVDLGFRISGRVIEVVKDEGDPVRKDQVLARIDPQPYQFELDRAEAELSAATAERQLKENGYRSEELEQARAVLEQSRVAEKDAERAHTRHRQLIGGGGTSQQMLESAEAALDETRQRVKVAQAQLELLEAGFRAEEIAAAGAREAQARAARDLARLRLADTTLKAPADGIVLTRATEPGAVVQAGATVMSLSLEHPVWVRAYVHESELGKVPPGTKVKVFTDSRPDHPYHGQVGFVSPRAEFTPKSVETPELRTSLVYRLRVVVNDADGGLRQGMPVTVLLEQPSS